MGQVYARKSRSRPNFLRGKNTTTPWENLGFSLENARILCLNYPHYIREIVTLINSLFLSRLILIFIKISPRFLGHIALKSPQNSAHYKNWTPARQTVAKEWQMKFIKIVMKHVWHSHNYKLLKISKHLTFIGVSNYGRVGNYGFHLLVHPLSFGYRSVRSSVSQHSSAQNINVLTASNLNPRHIRSVVSNSWGKCRLVGHFSIFLSYVYFIQPLVKSSIMYNLVVICIETSHPSFVLSEST